MIVIVMIVIFSFQVKRIYDKKGGNYKQINLYLFHLFLKY